MDTRDKKVIELTGKLYEAALDAARWPAFLSETAAAVGAPTSLMWQHDFKNDGADFSGRNGDLSFATGVGQPYLDSYLSHYSSTNVWAQGEQRHVPGSAGTSSMMYPDNLLKRTEFYGDWLRPLDLFYALGGILDKQGSRVTILALARSEKSGGYEPEELRVLQLLMPHLRTALALHRKMFRLEALASGAMQALDALCFGIVLLDAQGCHVHANRAAENIARKTGALTIGAGGVIGANSASATNKLQQLIRDAVRTGSAQSAATGGALRLPARAAPGERAELHVFVSPMPMQAAPFGQAVAAAIFCADPERPAGLAKSLERVYGMTPAEARLTEALVSGESLKQIAEQRRTTLNTVKTQLKSATAKAGAKRQVDLVRIVLTGPALLMEPFKLRSF